MAKYMFIHAREGGAIEEDEDQSTESMWDRYPRSEGEERAQILSGLARDALRRHFGQEALTLAQEAQAIYEALGAAIPGVEMAETIFLIGSALVELHREKEAAELLNQAIALQRDCSYQFVEDTLRTQGVWYGAAGEYELGLKSFLEAAQSDDINGDYEFLAMDLYVAGEFTFKLGRYKEAVDLFTQCRQILVKREDLPLISRTDWNLAECYMKLGLNESALSSAEQCYSIASLRKDDQYMCKGSFTKAKAHMALGDFDSAANDLFEADCMASSASDWELTLEIQKEYQVLHLNLNQFEAAQKTEARIATIREILG